MRLISFVYRTRVEGFETLRRRGESVDLHFFRPEELPDLDVIGTARPALDLYFAANAQPATLRN